jgi:hypothetical protein
MTSRMQITIEPDLRLKVEKRAQRQGISLAEVVRQALQKEVGIAKPQADVSVIFDLGRSAVPTNIVRDKNKMLEQALSSKLKR